MTKMLNSNYPQRTAFFSMKRSELQATIINHVIDNLDAQSMRKVLFRYMNIRYSNMYDSHEDLIILIKSYYPELSHLVDDSETVLKEVVGS